MKVLTGIEACLKFTRAVAEEFERLICAGAAAMDLPEVDDGKLDSVEQGSAAAQTSRILAIPKEQVGKPAGTAKPQTTADMCKRRK